MTTSRQTPVLTIQVPGEPRRIGSIRPSWDRPERDARGIVTAEWCEDQTERHRVEMHHRARIYLETGKWV